MGEGFTPLVDGRLGSVPIRLKLDFLAPTGSYKDRGSAVMMTQLKEMGVRRILEDSSGNAGASIAAYAALAGIEADIYVPESTSAGKMAQIESYGAHLVKVPGSREATAQAALDAADKTFYASHNWNPFFLAGMKTAAYEIAEQLGWKSPNWIVTPAGGGGLLGGLYLGFLEMVRAGFVSAMPRLAAAQSANCDPIRQAWLRGAGDIPAVAKTDTAAEGISVARPVRGKLILEAIRKSDGVVCAVTDEQIWQALDTLGEQGIYVEPTAAAAPAAAQDLLASRSIRAGETVVVMLTGSGLKATDKIVAHRAATREASAYENREINSFAGD